MFNKKKKGKAVEEEVKEVEQIAGFDDSIAGDTASEGTSSTSEDLGEMDLGTMGYVFDPEADVAYIDEETFDTLVDDEGMFTIETGLLDENGNKQIKRVKAKKVKGRKRKINSSDDFKIDLMSDENFGELLPYIKDKNITDINWNGLQLWIDDVTKGRYCVQNIKLSDEFVQAFSARVANIVSKSFNKYCPKLEAETDELRVTVIHKSRSHTGTAISIRKTPAVKRINFKDSIERGEYCTKEVANIMSNSVKAKMNIIIVGLSGVGKTELVKFLTNYIFPKDRVITIEDTFEIHYAEINDFKKDCLELKVDDKLFTYTDAIKETVRLMPQWVLLSEARSVEVKYLLESLTTGSKCITTLHTDDIRKIPNRILNMIGDTEDVNATLSTIYSFFDVAILIDKKEVLGEDGKIKINRWVSQIGYFHKGDSNDNSDSRVVPLVVDGVRTGEDFDEDHMIKYKKAGIRSPYEYQYI